MLKGGHHAFEHAAVHFDRAIDDVEADLLARFLGRLAHHAVEAIREAVELDHARAQQVVLQLTCEPRLSRKLVFGGLHGALEAAMHGGDVVDRLGQHARQFLEAREAIHLQRIEALAFDLGHFHAGTDLCFSLNFNLTQLVAHAIQVVGQIDDGTLELRHISVDARACDADLTGVVHQLVEQRRLDAHCAGARLRRRRTCGGGRCGGGRESRPFDLARQHDAWRRRARGSIGADLAAAPRSSATPTGAGACKASPAASLCWATASGSSGTGSATISSSGSTTADGGSR